MFAALVSVMAQFLPDDGPGQSGDFRVSPTFFVVLLGLGFLIGTLGHIIKSRTLMIAGHPADLRGDDLRAAGVHAVELRRGRGYSVSR